MSTLRLAMRNLRRAPRRTLLTMSAIIAGVGVFILGEGFVSGLTENILVAAIEGTVGHVQARPAGYPTKPGQHPVDALLEITPAARTLLDQHSVAWTTRTYFAPTAAAGADSLRAVAIGYDDVRDTGVFPRDIGFLPDGKTLVVAQYESRAVQFVPTVGEVAEGATD